MITTKDDIKKWLKQIEKDRKWLANQCFVTISAVNKWFERNQEIPKSKLALIEKLMMPNGSQADQVTYANFNGRLEKNETLVLQFSRDEWAELMAYKARHPKADLASMAEEYLIELVNMLLGQGETPKERENTTEP